MAERSSFWPPPGMEGAKMRNIVLLSGMYYAGLKRPALATRGMVEAAIQTAIVPQSLGRGTPIIRNFVWHERAKEAPPIDPTADPNYSDDWTEWFSVEYVSADPHKPLTFNVPDAMAWILAIPGVTQPHAGQPLPAPPAPPAPPDPTDPQPGQYPPTWAQPGSVPVPPLPNLNPWRLPMTMKPAPAGWGLLLLLFLLKRGRR